MRSLAALACTALLLSHTPIHPIYFEGRAQGTTYHITYYKADTVVTQKQVDSILNSLDSSLSIYKSYSRVSAFNNSATGILTDRHIRKVVTQAITTFHSTKGIFDITIYPLTEAWGFGLVKIDKLPGPAEVRSLLRCTGSNQLFWSGQTLLKRKACVRLDPNGIAQGYSVDVLADFLESNHITNYLVELGGEIRVRGRKQPGDKPMKVGIESPGGHALDVSDRIQYIAPDSGAITTSGSYRKFYESNGKQISHILDARTGYPSRNDLISVTVFARDALTADAYDNALMVMGLRKAIAFVEKRKDISAHFVFRRTDGSIGDTATSRFPKLMQ